MEELLTLQGEIKDLPVPELLRNLLKNEGAASLTIHHDEWEYRLYALDHKLVWGDTNDPDASLSFILFQKGVLSLETFLKVRHGEEKLVNLLEPDEVLEGIENQIRFLLTLICRLRHGRYILTFEDTPPEDAIRVSMDSYRAVLDAVRSIPYWSAIEKGLGGMKKNYRQTPGQSALFFSLNLKEEEDHLYTYLENALSIDELTKISYLSTFETARILWALKTINLVQEVAPGIDKPVQRQTEEILFKLSSIVENYNEAFARLYGILKKHVPDEIHDLVTSIILELGKPYQKLLENINVDHEGRLDFDQLYHNAIQNQVKDLQQTLMDLLNEYLYAWVLHLHQRLGREHQEEINAAISLIREDL